MNSTNARGYLPVIQAWADGKVIQIANGTGWRDADPMEEIDFCAPPDCYRVKPEPRRFWVYVNRKTNMPGPAWLPEQVTAFADQSELVECVEVLK